MRILFNMKSTQDKLLHRVIHYFTVKTEVRLITCRLADVSKDLEVPLNCSPCYFHIIHEYIFAFDQILDIYFNHIR